jgi:hypothetical protein
MHVLAITPLVQSLGSVPHGIVLYVRDHAFDPYVVHNYADHRASEDGTALELSIGFYCLNPERALSAFQARALAAGLIPAEGSQFLAAVEAFESLRAQNEVPR